MSGDGPDAVLALERVLHAGSPGLRSLFLAAALVLGTLLVLRDARAWPLSREQAATLFCWVFLGGLVGALVPGFVAGGVVQQSAVENVAVAPRTITGALVGGFFAAAVYKRLRRISFDTSDAFASATALGMAVGRLGCHVGHCCVGRRTDGFGLDFGDGAPRIPIQLYEAAVVFALFVLLEVLRARGALQNRRLFLFVALYGACRFFLETLREPVAATTLGLGSYQWFALALVALGAFQVWKRSRA